MQEASDAAQVAGPLLAEVEGSFSRFLSMAGELTAGEFSWQPPGEEWSIKRTLEHLANANNFAYAIVVAQARGLPSSHCLPRADFQSPMEAVMTVRVSHRRVVNQVAGITFGELTRPLTHELLGEVTVQDALRRMASHYQEHTAQIQQLREQYKKAF